MSKINWDVYNKLIAEGVINKIETKKEEEEIKEIIDDYVEFTREETKNWLNRKSYYPNRIGKKRPVRGSLLHRSLIVSAKKYFNYDIGICDSYISATKKNKWVMLQKHDCAKINIEQYIICKSCKSNMCVFVLHEDTVNETKINKDETHLKCPICNTNANIRYICNSCNSMANG